MKKLIRKISLIGLISILCNPGETMFAQAYASVGNIHIGYHDHKKKEVSGIPLKSVLKTLGAKHGVEFTFSEGLVKNKIVKDNYKEGEGVEEVLKKVLSPLGLGYEIIQNGYYVIIQKGEEKTTSSEDKEARSNKEDQKTINGVVTSADDGLPMPGVNILVKGTNRGTTTDFDGKYNVDAAQGDVLVFSYVGFMRQEVTVNDKSKINVALKANVNALDELVVVGYGTQKKSDLTGAVSTVSSEEINQVSEPRLETALQGRAAGVNVARNGGEPGAQAKVSIRGVGTFNDNGPLYVIDGVPQDPGVAFNPNDVESIEILKDASAAAIYGARAAHGVVLITTKRGKEGRIKISLTSSAGFREPLKLPDFLNTPDYITLATEARANAGIDPEPSWSNPDALPNSDWGGAVFGSGLQQSHNLSVSGGSENASFYLSGAYDKEEGIYLDSDFERYSFRANSDFQLGIFKIGESLLFTRTGNNPTADSSKNLNLVLRAVPTYNIHDPENPLGGWGRAPSYNNGANPVGIQEQTHNYNLDRRINGNIYAEVEPINGLKLRGSLGYNYGAGLFRSFIEEYDYRSVTNSDATLRFLSNDSESYNLNLVLTYDTSFNGNNITALAGVERFHRDGLQFDAQGTGFSVPNSESLGLATGGFEVLTRNSIGARYRLNSIFGRLGYDYKGKYLLQANIRRDGSSRFGSNNKYGVFPSASVGWRVSDENFMKDVDEVSNLKFRASYGVLGSDRIGDFNDASYSTNRSLYIFDRTGISEGDEQVGFYLDGFSNEDRKWEQVEQLDLGMDLALFKNTLSITADYYNKTTNDLLVPVPLPLSFGVSGENSGPSSVPVNLGSLENKGFELAVNFRKTFGDWKLNLSANGAYNKNTVTKLADDSPVDRSAGGPNNPNVKGTISRTVVGRPIGSFYGLVVDGVFQSQNEIDALNGDAPGGVYQENGTAPGDFRYKDLNGDGQITNDDRDFLGDPFPKYSYGFSAKVAYKGLDLSVFFQGVEDVEIFNATKAYFNTFYSDFNSTTNAFNRWTPQNPTNANPRLTTNDLNGNFQKPSSYFVEDGSYLKLRNVQLGYNLSKKTVAKIGITNARIYVSAQNIWTITGYSGLDPELSNGDGGNTLQGLDGLSRYPQTSLISAGIKLGF